MLSDHADHGLQRAGTSSPAVARAAAILDLIAQSNQALTLTRIAHDAQLAKSSALAICSSLTEARLLRRDPAGKYDLGIQVLALSSAYLRRTNLSAEFHRVCREVAELPPETLLLAVRDGIDVVYIARHLGPHPVAISYELGMRLPANCTASGKILLAAMSDVQLQNAFDAGPLRRLTGNGPEDMASLARQLDEVRDHGYAVDDEEAAVGMICFGAPVHGISGDTVGAVAVSLVKPRLTDEYRQVLIRKIILLGKVLSVPGNVETNSGGSRPWT